VLGEDESAQRIIDEVDRISNFEIVINNKRARFFEPFFYTKDQLC